MEEDDSRDRGTERTVKKLGLRTSSVNLGGGKWELISQGAEARIFRGIVDGRRAIAKQRFTKKYRHPVLDKQLSRERLRSELRSIVKCRAAGVATPEILMVDIEQRVIVMEEVAKGVTLKERIKALENQADASPTLRNYAEAFGQLVGKLHCSGMVHGDLTTSNVLMDAESDSLSVIDFGLSGWDRIGAEEKAVDLYVLERALASSHPNMECFVDKILESYAAQGDAKKTLSKLEEVRLRGRKRSMVG